MVAEANHGIEKIVSGGQTGVDRGALDAAIALNINHGGWCPKGRIAEDGPIASTYRLQEMPQEDYSARTEKNVIDSDGTLILYRERLSGGTLLTNRLAKRHGRPLHRVRLDRTIGYTDVLRWLRENQVKILNIAGPRGSSHPKMHRDAYQFVINLMQHPVELLDE